MKIKQLGHLSLFLILFISACSDDNSANTPAAKKTVTENNISMQDSTIFTGKLLETLDSGGYTYVQIMTSSGPLWAAGPITPVNVGDTISFNGKMLMENFHSNSLGRDFDMIYFANAFTVNGVSPVTPASSPNPHKNTHYPQQETTAAAAAISPLENGQTIADVWQNKTSLADKTVKIRGRVSKYTTNILDTNWIHIRDNSSQQDLTITTSSTVANIDDIILVEGKLAINKDFGNGFVYDVIVEDAKITVE